MTTYQCTECQRYWTMGPTRDLNTEHVCHSCLEAANAKLELTLKGAVQRGGELLGENAKLREALRFYAEPGNYSKKLTYLGTKPCVGPSVVERDWGETARKALEE